MEEKVPEGYCKERPSETNDFIFQQTMYRIKDPKASLDFYSRILGMRLLAEKHFPEAKFSLYFMGYVDEKSIPKTEPERSAWLFQQPATLELTHNHGTESDPEFKGYHNGNADPRGYGHIGLSVNNVDETCERFEKLGVKFQKKPNDGKKKTFKKLQKILSFFHS